MYELSLISTLLVPDAELTETSEFDTPVDEPV